MANPSQNKVRNRIFINQQKLEQSLVKGLITLEGSTLRSGKIDGYYQLIPAIKFTSCVSSPEDPLGYVGKCAALALLEQKGIEIEMHSIDYQGETFEVDEGFLGDFHKETEIKAASEANDQSDERINYNPSLIRKLHDDHKLLYKILDEIKAAISIDDYRSIPGRLDAFKNKLRIHLMKKQAELHKYIEVTLSHSEKIQKMNKTFQRKILRLNQAILQFIERYKNSSWNGNDKKSFNSGLKNLEKILTESITIEEELYELYLPKSAYNGVT